jgi:hypothetical protein
MSTNDYQALAAAYTRDLQGLFEPPAAGTRAEAGQLPPGLLAERADRLAEQGAQLIEQTATYLADDDPIVQLGAEQHLLAQAVASLRVAEALLATEDLQDPEAPARAMAKPPEPPDFDELAAVLEAPLGTVGAMTTAPPAASRTVVEATPDELITSSVQTIDSILDGVAEFSQDTFAGLIGLDTALLKQAAEMISDEMGDLIEQLGERASRLVARALAFIVQAYDSLLASLGQDVTSELRLEAAEWVQELQQGGAVSSLLGRVLEVPVVRQRITDVVQTSTASALVLGQAEEQVKTLVPGYLGRTKLAGQLLAALGLLKRIPAARLPMVELASAVLYVTLLGYNLYVGADYIDAPRMTRLGRIPGVLQVLEAELQVA